MCTPEINIILCQVCLRLKKNNCVVYLIVKKVFVYSLPMLNNGVFSVFQTFLFSELIIFPLCYLFLCLSFLFPFVCLYPK